MIDSITCNKFLATCNFLNENDGTYLITATYLQFCGQGCLASLVAHHSEAQFEAHLRGLLSELDTFPRQCSPISDALKYCDITKSPKGRDITLRERTADIFSQYGEAEIVSQAIRQAVPSLFLAVERTQRKIDKYTPV